MQGCIEESLSGRDNALNAVRLGLAVVVIVGHSWPLSGTPGEPPLGHWAVAGFFAISGYLIAQSRAQLRLGTFIKRRLLRIMPAFWASLVLVAVVLAPASTLLTGERLVWSSALRYVVDNAGLLVGQWGVGDTLTSVPYPGVWNGSLWTLYFEALAYLMAAVVIASPLCRRWPVPTLALLHGLFVWWVAAQATPAGWLGAFFTAGMFLWAVRRFVPASPVVMGASAIGAVVAAATGWFDVAAPLPVAALLLTAGARLSVRVGSSNDLSYGTYVFAFPLQQFLAVAGVQRLGVFVFAALSIALTVPVAWASWRWIEAPAMRWGRRRSPLPSRPRSEHPSLSGLGRRMSHGLTRGSVRVRRRIEPVRH